MHSYSTVSPIAQRLVQVHAIVEKIAGVNGPLISVIELKKFTILGHYIVKWNKQFYYIVIIIAGRKIVLLPIFDLLPTLKYQEK